jgi:hypothetical protein
MQQGVIDVGLGCEPLETPIPERYGSTTHNLNSKLNCREALATEPSGGELPEAQITGPKMSSPWGSLHASTDIHRHQQPLEIIPKPGPVNYWPCFKLPSGKSRHRILGSFMSVTKPQMVLIVRGTIESSS